ncbi:MAG: hypothetical protein WAV50_02695, partial [Minisyncoccia bacterium]
MTKNLLQFSFVFLILVSPVFVREATAASLSQVQINIIVQLLQSFGVDQTVINNLQTSLGGAASSIGGGNSTSLTINGQSTVSNGDPLLPRTWTWSSPAGTTASASVTRSGCVNPSQNGTTNPWTPWEAGESAQGSNTTVLGTAFYGCTIAATYTATSATGQSEIARATIVFKRSATEGVSPVIGTPPVLGTTPVNLCAQQGLTNAAGQQPNLPLGIGVFSEVLTSPGQVPSKSFQIYGFERNQALVFPITVDAYDPNNPTKPGNYTLRIDSATYSGIENIVSISKEKCDFSMPFDPR